MAGLEHANANLWQGANCDGFAGDTGVPQLSRLLLSLSLAGFSALLCGLCFLLPSTLLRLLVKPTWCAGAAGPPGLCTAAGKSSQTAQLQISSPPALLPSPATWSLSFFRCLWGLVFYWPEIHYPKQCWANLTFQGLYSCVTGHKERNKTIMLDKQFL